MTSKKSSNSSKGSGFRHGWALPAAAPLGGIRMPNGPWLPAPANDNAGIPRPPAAPPPQAPTPRRPPSLPFEPPPQRGSPKYQNTGRLRLIKLGKVPVVGQSFAYGAAASPFAVIADAAISAREQSYIFNGEAAGWRKTYNCGGGSTIWYQAWPACNQPYPVDPGFRNVRTRTAVYFWNPVGVYGPHDNPFNPHPVWPTAIGGHCMERYSFLPPAPMPGPGLAERVGDQTRASPRYRFPRAPKTEKHAPPKPKEREAKLRVNAAVMGVARAAWAATEAFDAIDAIFKSLPKSIQATANKSGRTDSRARVGKGVPYSTPWDKAQTVFGNWNSINIGEATKNLIINHFVDAAVGGTQGRAGQNLQGWGVSGGGFALPSAPGPAGPADMPGGD